MRERTVSRSSDSNANSRDSSRVVGEILLLTLARGREDRRLVTKESDTFQRRVLIELATDGFSDARYFIDNERAGSHFSYSKGAAANSRGWGDRRSVVYARDMEDWRKREREREKEREGLKPR
ncbi:unnamed protein product, partial [Brassica oleracea]